MLILSEVFKHTLLLNIDSSLYVRVSSGGSSSSSGAMNSGLPASAAPLGGVGIPGVKVKFCRYYAKDKTCFYGDECQFLHEDPSMASLSLHGGGTGAGGGGGGSPVSLSLAGGAVTAAGYVLGGSAASGVPASVSKKNDSLGPEGQLLSSKFALRPNASCPLLLLLFSCWETRRPLSKSRPWFSGAYLSPSKQHWISTCSSTARQHF